jgi:SAM-dependent methyltransferase
MNQIDTNVQRIAEVGSGIGLVAEAVGRLGYDVEAFEPESAGFGEISALANPVVTKGKGSTRYFNRALDPRIDGPYDFIYSINVLEHVADHRSFLVDIFSCLKPGGRAFLVFPNYSFPYEPHFNIPVVLTKQLTARIYSGRIHSAAMFDPTGMWEELSFPKSREIKRMIIKSLGDEVVVREHKFVLRAYFARITSDPKFAERKTGFIFRAARKAGQSEKLLRILTKLVPSNFNPIAALTIQREVSDGKN